jgi:hypothetical protein
MIILCVASFKPVSKRTASFPLKMTESFFALPSDASKLAHLKGNIKQKTT